MYVHIQLPHCTVVIQIQDHIITFVCVCVCIYIYRPHHMARGILVPQSRIKPVPPCRGRAES